MAVRSGNYFTKGSGSTRRPMKTSISATGDRRGRGAKAAKRMMKMGSNR